MIQMQPEASRRLSHYLDQVRAALRGSRSLDPHDVETDVTAHIQSELAGLPGPVTLAALDAVLERLGSPLRWVPAEEQTVWRRVLTHLRAGPEDWRLAYLCLGMLLGASIFAPIGFGPAAGVLFLASYALARAVLTLFEERGDDLGAQRWFVYPTLVLAHGLVLLTLLGLPLFATVAAADEIVQIEALRPRVPELVAKHAFLLQRMAEAHDSYDLAVGIKHAGHVLLGVLGPWLVLLGLAGRHWPQAPARIFRPLLAGLRRRHANLVLALGIAACVLALVLYGGNA